MTELVTDRLLMRHWSAADREPFAQMNVDPEVMRYFPALMTRAQSDAFVDKIEARFAGHGHGLWALEVVETGSFIGFTGLIPMPDGVPSAGETEVGWRLVRTAWGHGYATEAARAAVAYAFGEVGLDRLWSMTAVPNEPSRRVMERLGMHLDREFDHPRVPQESGLRRHVLYRLDRPTRALGQQVRVTL